MDHGAGAGGSPTAGPAWWCRPGWVGTSRGGGACASRARTRFLSLGCGGGLVPWLRTGDVVVATEVVRLDAIVPPQGTGGGGRAARRPRERTQGAMASSPGVLLTTAEKTAAAGCGALLVDMESWTLADEAERRGVPFAAVRVVLDAVTDELPALSDAIDAGTGDIDLWRVARALVPRPWIWPAVLRIARQQWEAERRLAEAVALLLRCHPSTWTREDTRDGRRPAVRDRPVDERQRLPDLADSGRRCGGPGGRARHRG